MSVIELSKENVSDAESWLSGDGVRFVKFWAPWCGPCRAMDAPYHEVAKKESSETVKFASMNIDESPTLAAKFKVRSIPFILALKNGQPINQLIGAVPVSKLTNWINNSV